VTARENMRHVSMLAMRTMLHPFNAEATIAAASGSGSVVPCLLSTGLGLLGQLFEFSQSLQVMCM
jgi:hypothetical protein